MAEQQGTQQRHGEFLDLLPLTVTLAGLSRAERGKSFSEDQLEARAMVIKKAYRQARKTMRDCLEG